MLDVSLSAQVVPLQLQVAHSVVSQEKKKANPVIILRLSLAVCVCVAFVSGVDLDRIQHLAIQNVFCVCFVSLFRLFQVGCRLDRVPSDRPVGSVSGWSFYRAISVCLLSGLLC